MGGVPPTAECGSAQGIRRANPVELPLILNSAKIGALLGRVGNGPWFKIGEQARVTAQTNGELFLLFNDRPCCYGDNSGAVTVTIQKITKASSLVVQALNQNRTPTGVVVRRGQQLFIEAKGEWCMGGIPPTAECGSAQGIRQANPVELPLILNSAKIGALLGRVGNGPWFKIGEQARVTAQTNGELFLLFNDRPCCYGDNSGHVRVNIYGVRK